MLKIAWAMIIATNVLNVTAFALDASDSVCRKRMHRCERRCATDNTIGSMEHLKCNERCWEQYRWCREEGP
jgi:hypothetical protein